jgi:type I restriction enzyme S subunit
VTEWRELRLGDALTIKHGFTFKSRYFTEDSRPYIVLTPGNFHDSGGFKQKSGAEKYYDGPLPTGYVLDEGDVVIAMTEQAHGLLGSSATIPSGGSKYLHNQRIGLVRITDSAALDLRFAYHLFNAPAVRKQVQATATGSKVRHTAPVRIEGVRVAIPTLPTQRRIAGVLDAVDDLIENNRQRIALLEQMAQAIYREWFVHFRYPGHEDDELVDSPLGPIPATWSAAQLGDVIELRYGKSLKASARRGGPVAVVGSSGVVGWHNESLVSGPAVIVGRKGNVGSVIWIQGESWPIDTTYYVTTDLPLHFVFRMLSEIEFIDSHAAVPGLSRDQAYSIDVLRPDTEVAGLFDDTASELSAIRSVLERQAAVLSRVRDALLPKLVTGVIDVSKLDLDGLLEESAA